MSRQDKTRIFILDVPKNCSSDVIRRLFEQYGDVRECDITNRYAFVHMSTAEQAIEAVKNLNNYNLMGSIITVQHSTVNFPTEPRTPGQDNQHNSTRIGNEQPHTSSYSDTHEGQHCEGPLMGEHSAFDKSYGFMDKDHMRTYPPPIWKSNMLPQSNMLPIGSDPYTKPQSPIGMLNYLCQRGSPPLLSMSCSGQQRNDYEPPPCASGFSPSYANEHFEDPPMAGSSSSNCCFGFWDRDSMKPNSTPSCLLNMSSMGSDPLAKLQSPIGMQDDMYERTAPPIPCIRMTATETLVAEEVPIEVENKTESCAKEVKKLSKKLEVAERKNTSYKKKIYRLNSKFDAVQEKLLRIKEEIVAVKEAEICIIKESEIKIMSCTKAKEQIKSDYDTFLMKMSKLRCGAPLNVALKAIRSVTAREFGTAVDKLAMTAEVTGTIDYIPPQGVLQLKDLKAGNQVFAIESTLYTQFCEATVLTVIDGEICRVKSVVERKRVIKEIHAKYLAYVEVAEFMVPMGTRVLGGFSNCMFAGVVLETPSITNRYRYLVLFDDTYTRYLHHKDIRVICKQGPDLYNDMTPSVRNFVQEYLADSSERFLLQLEVNQRILVESASKWVVAKVVKIDCSQVQIQFVKSKRLEWMYRGSSTIKLLSSKQRVSGPGSK